MIDCQKHLFNLNPGIHYLNCAYKAPLLKSAEEAAIRALKRERNPCDISPEDFFTETEKVKENFGKIVNDDASKITLIPSASYGFASVLNNIKARPGMKAITIKDEFPSGYFSLKKWCETNQNELVVVAPDNGLKRVGKNWNEKILHSIDEQTSIVLISSVHWMTGLKFDLKSIGEKCSQTGTIFIVDGTQSVGALPMDVKAYQIDALVCAGYKWLFGPYSLGLAYIGDQFENGIPLEESWINRTNAKNFNDLTHYEAEYWPNAGRYNVGETSNFILMPILHEALKQINLWTVNAIQAYCQNLISPLMDHLEKSGVKLETEKYFSNHLFSLPLPDDVDLGEFKKNLQENNVFISLRGQSLRISVNVFNDAKNIAKLIEVIDMTRRTATFK